MNNSPKFSLYTPNSIERTNNSFCKNYSFYSPKNLMMNVNYLKKPIQKLIKKFPI